MGVPRQGALVAPRLKKWIEHRPRFHRACEICISPNSWTIVCKEVKVGLPETHNFDLSRALVLLVLRGCLCFAGMPNKYSDAVMMQFCVFQACRNYQNINCDV